MITSQEYQDLSFELITLSRKKYDLEKRVSVKFTSNWKKLILKDYFILPTRYIKYYIINKYYIKINKYYIKIILNISIQLHFIYLNYLRVSFTCIYTCKQSFIQFVTIEL